MKLKPHKHFTTGQPCNCTWAKHTVPEWEDHHVSKETPGQEFRRWQDLYPSQGVETAHQWPDGWSVRHNQSVEAINRVGEMMRNCWQGVSGDWATNRAALNQYYSLHDEQGIPRVAFHWRPHNPEDESAGHTLSEPLAARNQAPSAEHAERLLDFANAKSQHPTYFTQGDYEPLDREAMYAMVGRFNELHQAKQASVPSIDELTPHRYDRECYEVAGSIAQKYPHLKQDAGFYVHPERGAGDHGWNIAPDGTIVDMTAAQHDYNGPEDEPEDDGPIAQPKHPEIVTPDMPEYSRYVSWSRHEPQAQSVAHDLGYHGGHNDNIDVCAKCQAQAFGYN